MTVLCPGDTFELRALLRQALKINGPVYLRLGKKGEENVHREVPTVEIGKGLFIAEGNDLCLLSTGNTLPMALSTAHLLRQAGVEASVVSMHTIKPLCQKFISEIFDRFTIVATIEEHSLVGGLGSLVAEWLADHKKIARLYRFGTKDKFPHLLGSQDFLRSQNDLLPEHIYNKLIIEIQELCKH
jgi:transketolase